MHWLASETYHIILMEKLEDKSILLSWKTRYSKVGLNVLLPQPPLPPPKKNGKNLRKLKKGNKPFLLCVTFSVYLPRSWMSCSVWKTMAQEIIFYQRKKNRLPLNHSREWRNSIIQDHKFYNKREREKVNKQTLLETRSSYASFGNSMYHSII